MACYNHEEYVEAAIESVLDQTYPNIEFIVVDNGSTDHSYEKICQYKNRIEKIYHLQKNDIYECNAVMDRLITGDYVAVMTSDDYWDRTKIEKQIEILEKMENVKACATWAYIGDENLKILENIKDFKPENYSRKEWIRRLLEKGNCLAWPSVVIEKKTYDQLKQRGYRQLGDYFIWLQILLESDIYVIPEELVIFRRHMSGNNRNESSPTHEVIARTTNEMADIVDYVIDQMGDELFLEVFSDWMIKKFPRNHIEYQCERFFVLKKLAEKNLSLVPYVLNFYFENQYATYIDSYDDRSFGNVLKREYSYSPKMFHEWSGSIGYDSLDRDFCIYKDDVQREFRRREQRIAGLQKSLKFVTSEQDIINIQLFLYQTLSLEEKEGITYLKSKLKQIVNTLQDDWKSDTLKYQKLLQNIFDFRNIVEQMMDVLKYIFWGVETDDWELFKVLLSYAEIQEIDLEEAVVPFILIIDQKLEVFG